MIFLRLTDKITAAKIHNGDVQAFENLIDKYKTTVFNYCLRIINNYHKAEEITQEVFIKVYNNIATYDSQKSALSTWIFTIAHNTCINSFRNSKREISLDKIDIQSNTNSLEEQFIVNDNLSKLSQAIQELSVKYRSLIIMKDYLGLKCNEISKILNLPEGSVKSGLHHARLKIRTLMGDIDD